MKNTTKCKNCGTDIHPSVKFCPNCGAKRNNTKFFTAFPAACAVIVVLLIVVYMAVKDKDTARYENNNIQNPTAESTQTAIDETEETTGPIFETNFDDTGYIKLSADVLFSYGEHLVGQNVITVVTIADISGSTLKANTEGGGKYVFDISLEFADRSIINGLDDGGVVTVCGAVSKVSTILGSSNVTIADCKLIGRGEIEAELEGAKDEQIILAEQIKKDREIEIATAAAKEKEEYSADCITVDYTDVARNPGNYKGTKIKIAGKVMQVSEGFFDTVTMRIDCGGNIWYVTYTRPEGESRILEGDYITAYGECDGVETYTSVVGSSVTIPSMGMKYYN